ncbi:MAG: M28 family peptidase [Candidatus Hodarchaeota archaeon]
MGAWLKLASIFTFLLILGINGSLASGSLGIVSNERKTVLKPQINYTSEISRKILAQTTPCSDLHPLWRNVFHDLRDTEWSIQANVRTISERFPGRQFGIDTNVAALEWYQEALLEFTDDRIEISVFGEYSNLIGILEGSDPTNDQVIIFGSTFDTWSESPGANDDAVTMAISIELARYFSANPIPAQIYFLGFNGEHLFFPSQRGQRELGPYLNSLGLNVTILIDVDSTLYRPPGQFSKTIELYIDDIAPVGAESPEKILQGVHAGRMVSLMSANYGQDIFLEINRSSVEAPPSFFRSFPNLYAIQRYGWGNDSPMGTGADTYDEEGYSYSQAAEITASIAAASTYLAYERSNGDLDGDGLPDYEEIALGTYPDLADTDYDGLTDYDEVTFYATNPLLPDTDDDDLPDSSEVHIYFTDPLDPDSDDDGLNDFTEVTLVGTSPLRNDTDGDYLSDFEEFVGIFIGIDFPGADSEGYITTLPTKRDTDGDGLDDGYELYSTRTDPRDRDTDNDGHTDGEEVSKGFDPLNNEEYPPEAGSDDSSATEGSPGFIALIVFPTFLMILLMRLTTQRRTANLGSRQKRNIARRDRT